MTPPGRLTMLKKMWGYAEGNKTIVAIVVILVAVAAVAYLARRLWRR